MIDSTELWTISAIVVSSIKWPLHQTTSLVPDMVLPALHLLWDLMRFETAAHYGPATCMLRQSALKLQLDNNQMISWSLSSEKTSWHKSLVLQWKTGTAKLDPDMVLWCVPVCSHTFAVQMLQIMGQLCMLRQSALSSRELIVALCKLPSIESGTFLFPRAQLDLPLDLLIPVEYNAASCAHVMNSHTETPWWVVEFHSKRIELSPSGCMGEFATKISWLFT